MAAMRPLSERAAAILNWMEPDRRYDASEIRALVPDTSMESLREVMHELWVNRYVERDGYLGWRRDGASTQPQVMPNRDGDPGCRHAGDGRGHDLPGQSRAVRPEDLFDHDSFSDFFK
jgi:hypothetical protein